MNKPLYVVTLTILLSAVAPVMALGQISPDRLLLKDYRPESIFKVPHVVVAKSEYPVIDMNSRPYATSRKQLAKWVQCMDSAGVAETVIMTGACGRKFDSLSAFYSHYPGRFVLFCGFDLKGYDKPGFGPAAVKELKRCFEEGARGVGVLVDRSRGFVHGDPPAWWMHIDDPRLDPLLNECAKLGMPVSISIGRPQWCYERMDSTNDGLMSSYKNWFTMGWDLNLQQELKHLAHALAMHPNTVFIATHLANQVTDLAKLAKLFDRYPNIYADISGTFAEIATIPRYAGKIIERYRDRILYGTGMGSSLHMYRTTFTILQTSDEHFYDFKLFDYHWPLYGLGLGRATLKRLYWSNASKVLKLERKF